MEGLTEKQVEDINKLVKKCKIRVMENVCRDAILPCERTIDRGQCQVIIEYLKNQNS